MTSILVKNSSFIFNILLKQSYEIILSNIELQLFSKILNGVALLLFDFRNEEKADFIV